MHKEKGFFCSVPLVYEMRNGEVQDEQWFGPRTNEQLPELPYESVNINGMKLFSSHEEAERAKKELENSQGYKGVEIGYLDMDIAETREDWEHLREEGKDIVILYTTFLGGTEIRGPNTSEYDTATTYPCEAELYTVNGHQTFEKYPKWVYGNDARQGGKCNLATIVDFRKPVQENEEFLYQTEFDFIE